MPRRIPAANYPAGTYQTPGFSIPLGLATYTLSLDTVNHLLANVVWSIAIELSLNNGGTWRHIGGCSRSGGPGEDRQGNTAATLILSFAEPSNPDRKVRASLTITGGSLTTSVDTD